MHLVSIYKTRELFQEEKEKPAAPQFGLFEAPEERTVSFEITERNEPQANSFKQENSFDEEKQKEFAYRFGNNQNMGADVTRASYIFNQGGRVPRAFGGIMDSATGRKAYGLGSIFKSIGKAAKKVLSSDIGKAAIAGAAFLKAFVGKDIPWTHFDVAGTSWGVENRSYIQKDGASGQVVRLVLDLIGA